jgi:AraC family transcriptional regulator of adaptative response/methylated-DNA-[protein]-cysteine methyltransferase
LQKAPDDRDGSDCAIRYPDLKPAASPSVGRSRLTPSRRVARGRASARFDRKEQSAAGEAAFYISRNAPCCAEVIMSERIRYAWGTSSLGDFIAAASDHGLVAFEFADCRAVVLDALCARFPAASLTPDDAGLVDVVAKLAALIDHPGSKQAITLDPRGSHYEKRVWSLLREIPAGETTTYGALAARLGTRDARDVTEAIAANAIAILIPCHRVVKKSGSLSGYR